MAKELRDSAADFALETNWIGLMSAAVCWWMEWPGSGAIASGVEQEDKVPASAWRKPWSTSRLMASFKKPSLMNS